MALALALKATCVVQLFVVECLTTMLCACEMHIVSQKRVTFLTNFMKHSLDDASNFWHATSCRKWALMTRLAHLTLA